MPATFLTMLSSKFPIAISAKEASGRTGIGLHKSRNIFGREFGGSTERYEYRARRVIQNRGQHARI
jgi:hypothetical protein